MIGYAFCGSFCTHQKSFQMLEKIIEMGYEVQPIMSDNVYTTDTRFGKASELIKLVSEICQKNVIHTIVQAEPLGPKIKLDALIISPCTGNTLAKIANGISYFGAAYSVLAMLFIIYDVCQVRKLNWLKGIFLTVSTAAFLLAASGEWLGLYYRSMDIINVGGMTKLVKEYGPLQPGLRSSPAPGARWGRSGSRLSGPPRRRFRFSGCCRRRRPSGRGWNALRSQRPAS